MRHRCHVSNARGHASCAALWRPMATEHSPTRRGEEGQGGARPVWHASMRKYMIEALDEEINALHFYATSDQWVEEVKALSDEERKKQLQAAMKGGSMVKYSSRGRATALMFFRLSADTDMLKWAPVDSHHARKLEA